MSQAVYIEDSDPEWLICPERGCRCWTLIFGILDEKGVDHPMCVDCYEKMLERNLEKYLAAEATHDH